MAPVGIFGTLDAKSHGAVALVYVVATVAMAFTAFSYAQMVRVAPQAGSVFTYARKGLGDGPGFIAGWMAMLDYLLIPAVAYLFSGIAMEALVPEVDRWVWTALAVVVTTLLNLWGVRAAARVGLRGARDGDRGAAGVRGVGGGGARAGRGASAAGRRRSPGTRGFSLTAVLSAVSVAVLSYLGFDAIASFAEEVTGGSRQVAGRCCSVWRWRACCSWRRPIWWPCSSRCRRRSWRPSRVSRARPSTTRWTPRSAGGCTTWSRSSKAIGAAFAALAGQAAAGRLLFAMARDRRLPHALSRTDSGVPRLALLMAAAVTMVAAVWAARRDDGLDHLVSVVDIGALTAFVLLHATRGRLVRGAPDGRPAGLAAACPGAAARRRRC